MRRRLCSLCQQHPRGSNLVLQVCGKGWTGSPWRDLWPGIGKYCYLDVPAMPTEFGNYTLEVYFNGATALTKDFSIISDIG